MYNTTIRSFTLMDASGSYSWIVENMEPADCRHMTDGDLLAWIDTLIQQAKEQDEIAVAEQAESQSYPCYGYTTDVVFESAEGYQNYKRFEMRSDYERERESVLAWLRAWIAS